jgi:hypothetical protein
MVRDQALMRDVRVRVPSTLYRTGRVDHNIAWYKWLCRGMAAGGADWMEDPALDRACYVGRDAVIFAVDVRVQGETIRCWLYYGEFESRHYELIGDGDLYFCVNLTHDDYQAGRALPLGQCAAPSFDYQYLDQLPRLRMIRDQECYDWDIVAMMRAGLHDYRVNAIRRIRRITRWKSLTAVAPFRPENQIPSSVQGELLPFIDHLEAQCRSRLCLALPGVGNVVHLDWSWRHTELLGMGCCILTIKPQNVWIGDPQDCWIECRRSLSDLVQKIHYWLPRDKEREEIAARALAYYEQWVSPAATARHIVRSVRERI